MTNPISMYLPEETTKSISKNLHEETTKPMSVYFHELNKRLSQYKKINRINYRLS